MLHAKSLFSAGMICSAVLAVAAFTGCRSSIVPIEVTVPGEFNLSGVSKIAMVNFNSLPDDPLTGTYSADPEIRSIVQRMVASAFYRSQIYQVVDLDIEKSIVAAHGNARISNRYDAVIYGRLWWQLSPEYNLPYPRKFTLETWQRIKYVMYVDPQTNRPVYGSKNVTRRMQDVLVPLYYRACNANLMLSLSLYRVKADGQLEKTTETFAVASQNILIDNGRFSSEFVPHGADGSNRASRLKKASEERPSFSSVERGRDVSGRFVSVQNMNSLPTPLQLKLMLAGKLSADLVNRLSPSRIVFNISCDFSDDKLFNLMKDGAFKAAREYVNFVIRTNAGNEIADKIDPLSDTKAYPVPRYMNPAKAPEKITDELVDKTARQHIDYLYALALSEEAMGEYGRALDSYRYIFNLKPNREYALGISRCLFALGMNDRVQEKKQARKDAAGKAGLK